MRYLITLFILLAIGSSLAQEKPPYADYLKANATVSNAMVSFFVTNISDCNIDSITVRVAHNDVYNSYDKDSLLVNLKPGESGVAALNLSQVPGEGWGWTIDGIETSKSDKASCGYTGAVNFEQIPLGGSQTYPGFNYSPIRSADGSVSYPLTRQAQATATPTPPASNNGFTTTPLESTPPASQAPVANPNNNWAANSNTSFYYVVKGDTLYSLAKRFNVSVDYLKQLNNLSSDNLRLGQKLFVSGPITDNANSGNQAAAGSNDYQFEYTLYAVKKGDTIYSIAKKHLITVPVLMAANCLNSNSIIKASSILKIPKPGSIVNNQCN